MIKITKFVISTSAVLLMGLFSLVPASAQSQPPAQNPPPSSKAQVPPTQVPPTVEMKQGDPGDKPLITVDFRDTPLRQALELIFSNARANYTIANNVPNGPVTLRTTEVKFYDVINLVLRSAHSPEGRLIYNIEGDVTNIILLPGPKKPQPTVKTEKIPLMFASITEVLPVVHSLLPSVQVTPIPGENAVLVTGTPELITQVREMVQAVDVAPITVQLRATVSLVGPKGRKVLRSTEVQAVHGTEAVSEEQGGISVAATPAAAKAANAPRLRVQMRPEVLGSNRLSVANTWDISLPFTTIASGKPTTVLLVKRLSTTSRLHSGQTIIVGEVSGEQWGGSGKIVLELHAKVVNSGATP